jgi:hypothetical protein
MFDMTRAALNGMVVATALLLGTLVFTVPSDGDKAKPDVTPIAMPSQQMSKSLQKAL